MKRLLGAHTIDVGGIDMAVRRAAAAKMAALQIFTAIPKYYNDKVSIRPERAQRFRDALDESGIAPKNVIAHAAYTLNNATTDEEKRARAAAGLAKELERSTLLGIGAACFHPGAATDGDRMAGAARVGRALAAALEKHPASRTRLLIENTAGAGNALGRNPEEIAAILYEVPPALRERTGYGLDTCHLYSAGYDIAASREAFAAVLDEFEVIIGEPPAFFHLNDSEGALGSTRDRHVLLGEGRIGAEPFRWLLEDERSEGIPLVLETPQANPDIEPVDPTPDPYDVRMMALLRSFLR